MCVCVCVGGGGAGGKQRGALPHTTHLVNGKMDREKRVYRGTREEGGSGGGRSGSGKEFLLLLMVVLLLLLLLLLLLMLLQMKIKMYIFCKQVTILVAPPAV